MDRDLNTQLQNLNSYNERIEHEFEEFKSKYENEHQQLLEKIKEEAALTTKVAQLEEKNRDLQLHIKNVIDSKEGFEFLQNTVSELSLALISKNDKDMSVKQIHLIKDLFPDSQLEAINSMKKKVGLLESDKQSLLKVSKTMIDQNSDILKALKKYELAVKE